MRLLIALVLWGAASVPLGLLAGRLLHRRSASVADEAEHFLRSRAPVARRLGWPGAVAAVAALTVALIVGNEAAEQLPAARLAATRGLERIAGITTTTIADERAAAGARDDRRGAGSTSGEQRRTRRSHGGAAPTDGDRRSERGDGDTTQHLTAPAPDEEQDHEGPDDESVPPADGADGGDDAGETGETGETGDDARLARPEEADDRGRSGARREPDSHADDRTSAQRGGSPDDRPTTTSTTRESTTTTSTTEPSRPEPGTTSTTAPSDDDEDDEDGGSEGDDGEGAGS